MKILRHPLFMRPTPESELEQWIDRELRQLPRRRAPDDLLPSVLQAIGEQARRPWWRKSFAHWPSTARFLFVFASSGLAALLVYFSWGLSHGVSWGRLLDSFGAWSGRLDAVRGLGGTLASALVLLGRAGGAWVLWGTVGVLGACYATTLTLGTVCYRLATPKS